MRAVCCATHRNVLPNVSVSVGTRARDRTSKYSRRLTIDRGSVRVSLCVSVTVRASRFRDPCVLCVVFVHCCDLCSAIVVVVVDYIVANCDRSAANEVTLSSVSYTHLDNL